VIAEIVSLSGYEAQVSALLSEEERTAMEFFVACAPEDHPVISGTGGFRKARWPRGGRGKSGGLRVIYFFLANPGRIYMAGVYAKSRKENLSAADQHVLEKLAAQIGCKRKSMSNEVGQMKTGTGKRTRLGLVLEESAKEILAHVKGEKKLPTKRIVLPDEVDVKRIRSEARMSQAEFSRAFCINPRTLQEWEQGRRKPDATTRAYLAVIARNRKAVLDALTA